MGGRLVLKLGHAAQFPEHGVAVEHPGQLRVLGHMGLDKDDALLRVQPTGDKLGIKFQGLPAQGRRVLADGDGVLIGDAIDGVIVLLQGNPVAQSPQVIAQGDLPTGLGGAENDLFSCSIDTSMGSRPIVLCKSPLGLNFMLSYLTTTASAMQESPE